MKKKTIIKISIGMLSFFTISNVGGLIAFNSIFNHYDFDINNYNGLRYEDIQDIKKMRFDISYSSNKEDLQGFLYVKPLQSIFNSDLIVISNGLFSCQEEYISIVDYFVSNFSVCDVLTYDYSGHGYSSGKSYGFCQSTIDLEYTLKYIEENYPYYSNIHLFGFSCGGFASCAILNTYTNIKSVVSVSGFNDGKKLFGSIASNYAGFISYTGLLLTSIKQKKLFNEYNNYTATNGINNVDIPIFIACSKDDKLIRYEKDSIAINKDNITNPNVTYYIVNGYDHQEILYSDSANSYRSKFKSSKKEVNIDRELYSKINEDLFNNITEFYNFLTK